MHFESDVGTVDWDESAEAVCLSWKTFASGAEFREVVDAGIELLLRRKAKRWLGDLRHLGAVTQDDLKWSSESWFPRATAGGMAYLALVSPRKVVAQMAVKSFINKVNGRDLLIGNFDEIQAARTWLRSQK
jgi:hypothetical protein